MKKFCDKMAVIYLHFLVVVLNTLLLLWPLSAVGTMTAKEKPDQR